MQPKIKPSNLDLSDLDAKTVNGASVGMGPFNLIQLDDLSRLPSLDGSRLVNVPNMPFRGVAVYNSVSISVPSGVNTIMSFDSELYDTEAVSHMPDALSVLRVPGGVSKVQLIAQIHWPIDGNGYRQVQIIKNGNVAKGLPTVSQPGSGISRDSQHIASAIIDVIPNDKFEISLFQNSSSVLEVGNASDEEVGFFAMHFIE